MKLVVTHNSLRWILRWSQHVLVTGGVCLLGYCGLVLIDTWNFQREERHALENLLTARTSAAGPSVPVIADGLFGRIEIPRLGISVIVIEGTTRTTLRRAVGHISGTALPGQSGNIGISGHRDTFFRPLRNIRKSDVITLITPAGAYRYRVVSIKVVSPSDIAVLDSSAGEVLTLVTCYPFYFVGSAPDRFVVRAERIESTS
jgi:sortase A